MRPILGICLLACLLAGGGRSNGPPPGTKTLTQVAPKTLEVAAAPIAVPVLITLDVTPEPTPHLITPAPVLTAVPTPASVRTVAPLQMKASPRPTPTPTLKPTPKPTPTPSPTQSRKPYNREQVKADIRAAWAGDDDKAIRVVSCETGGTFDPRTTSSNERFLGLWQFDRETWTRHGGAGDPRDASPKRQTEVASKLFDSRGWTAWGGCGQA